jgi:hypothetical protein
MHGFHQQVENIAGSGFPEFLLLLATYYINNNVQ